MSALRARQTHTSYHSRVDSGKGKILSETKKSKTLRENYNFRTFSKLLENVKSEEDCVSIRI